MTTLREALEELVDLMQGVIDGNYKPDSFTLQPARAALAAEQGEPDKDLIIIGLKALSQHVRLVPAYANLVGDMDTVDIAVRKLKAAPQPAEQCPDCGKPLGSAGDIHTCSPQVVK